MDGTARSLRRPVRPASVGEALDWGRAVLAGAGVGSADLDAQVLLAAALGVARPAVFSRRGDDVAAPAWEIYASDLRRRAHRVPLAYILGRREFWSRDLHVDGRVLVPRPETEGVVAAALKVLRDGARVLDVGTGCGNIIIALAAEIRGEGWAALDISPHALDVARGNLAGHGLETRIGLLCSDLFRALRCGVPTFDAILANPPYIPTGELDALPPEVRYEPVLALDGGDDGLALVRRIVRESPLHLRRGGHLIMEFGRGQEEAILAEVLGCGHYCQAETSADLAGIERVLVAQRC